MMWLMRALALALVGAVMMWSAGPADAAFPEKPIRVIVPFAPGGRTDTVARLLAKQIEEQKLLPQPLVIVNMAGAGGAVGGRAVLTAEPDGYTILHWHFQMLIANAMGIVPFGPGDFVSLGFAGGGSPVWTVRKDSGIETLGQLVAKLKAKPDSMVEAIGIGSIPHFVGALLAQKAGFETRKVQAPSGADRLKLIAGGNADISLFAASEYLGFRDVGPGLRALVYFGAQRLPQLPDLPTAKELGYDVVWNNPNWWLAPKGTPVDRQKILADALHKAFESQAIKDYFAKNALDDQWTDGAEAQAEAVATLKDLKAVAATIK